MAVYLQGLLEDDEKTEGKMKQFEKLILEKLYVTEQMTLCSNYLVGRSFADIMPRIADELSIRLTISVAAHEIEKTPSSWWQHFKLECMPRWFVRRWPVKYIKTHIVVRCDPGRFKDIGGLSAVEIIGMRPMCFEEEIE